MKTSEKIQNEIDELEEEISTYEFGTSPYDAVNAELEYLYAYKSDLVEYYND